MGKGTWASKFNQIKSRFTGRKDDDYYEESYDDYEEDFDGYDDYDDDYGSSANDRYAVRRDRYEDDSSKRFADELDERYDRAVTVRPSRSYRSPRLVSIDDVRSHTSVYTGNDRPDNERSYSDYSVQTDAARTVRLDTPAVTSVATVAASVASPSGLDSLFGADGSSGQNWSGSKDAKMHRFGVSRSLEVVCPSTYAEAERIAKGLKAGDAMVLNLKNTPDNLSGRLIDFAFGVACALGATVERLCPKVYAITQANDLTESERAALKSKGVI